MCIRDSLRCHRHPGRVRSGDARGADRRGTRPAGPGPDGQGPDAHQDHPLTQALVGRFGQHHAFLCRMHLDRLDALEADIAKLSTRIEQALEPFRETLAHLDTIPGVGRDVAEVIIAETGADMSRFPTPGHLASWAGVAPGLNQSGERNKPANTRHGDHWLTGALGVAAMAANRTKDTTFLGARYRRLARRIGKLKALVAIEHSILTAVWHVLSENTDYHDLGGDYHAKRDPQRVLRRITRDANRPATPSVSTPSKPHNSPNAASLTAIFDAVGDPLTVSADSWTRLWMSPWATQRDDSPCRAARS